MSRATLCLTAVAALVVAASAWPSNQFVRLDTYSTNALCSAGTSTPSGSQYVAIDICSVTSGGGSRKYALAADNTDTVQYWTFTGNTCAAGASNLQNYSLSACPTGLSRAIALSSSVGLYSTTDYSDNSCTTVSSGPTFLNQGCSGGVQITVGSKLTVCYGTATDCSGDQTCASVSHDTCASDSGSSGSAMYDWNAASSATPAVALTAALIAVVAAVTKF